MREPSAELVGGGPREVARRVLRLGEELAKTFRPKLRTHATAGDRCIRSAVAPRRIASVRDSALCLLVPAALIPL